jgi:hypothetical protein
MYAVVYNTTDGDLELSSGLIDNPVYNSVLKDLGTYSTNFSLDFSTDGTSLFFVQYGADDLIKFTLSTAWDISTATYSSYSGLSAGVTTYPYSAFWKSDGSRVYIADFQNATVYQSDWTNYSISGNASNDGAFVFNSSQISGGNLRGIAFNSDGTKLYGGNSSTKVIHQYSVSTAWDVSGTVTYESKSLDASGEMSGTMQDFSFNPTGTKLAVGDDDGNFAIYSLSTAYDVSTATLAGSITTGFNVRGLSWRNADLIFVIDDNTDVREYAPAEVYTPSGYHAVHTTASTDSTYWTDINSMTADEAAGDGSIFYCVSTDDRSTWKIAHNTDGIRSIVRNNSGTWQYNSNGTYASTTWTNATTNTELNALQEAMTGATYLGIGYVLDNSPSYDSSSFSVLSQDTAAVGLAFNTDGTKMFMLGDSSDTVYEYNLSTGFDLSTASYSSTSFSVASQDTLTKDVEFNNDGTKMYIVGNSNDSIFEYDLSTGFDLSTASYGRSFSVSGAETTPEAVAFNADGTKMFVLGNTGDDVNEYSLSTAFNVTSASYTRNFSVSSQDSTPRDLAFSTDGKKMFILGNASDTVYQYDLTTGFDLSTASYSSISFSVNAQEVNPYAMAFGGSLGAGTKMYILGSSSDTVFQYTTASDAYTNQT